MVSKSVHDYSSNNIDAEFIKENSDMIVHMHIHDAIGTKNHLVLGTGEVNLIEKINFAHEHCCNCVIETKTVEGLRKSISFLRENIL